MERIAWDAFEADNARRIALALTLSVALHAALILAIRSGPPNIPIAAGPPIEARIVMAEQLRKNIDPYIAAGHAQGDDVIDPAQTRHAIWKGLQVSRTKSVDRPWRKHGVLPV